MRPLIVTTLFGEKWHFFGDRLICSIYDGGWGGDILVLTDDDYHPAQPVRSSGEVMTMQFDFDLIAKVRKEYERQLAANMYWMIRYYIDQYVSGLNYDGFLYLDADVVVVPGRNVADLLGDGTVNLFTRDVEGSVSKAPQHIVEAYVTGGFPEGADPSKIDAVNAGTFYVCKKDLNTFCSEIRRLYLELPVITDQAAVNAYLWFYAKDFEWSFFPRGSVAYCSFYDYYQMFRGGSVLVHEIGNIKRGVT
jgi:hypothetical protein